jgi:hypothetical protein
MVDILSALNDGVFAQSEKEYAGITCRELIDQDQ